MNAILLNHPRGRKPTALHIMPRSGLLLLLICLLGYSPVLGAGTVAPIKTEADAELKVTVVQADTGSIYEETLGILPNPLIDPFNATAKDLEVLDGSGNLLVSTNGYHTARNVVVRDEGDFLRYIASATTNLGIERAGATNADGVEIQRWADVMFEFEITGGDMEVRLDHDTASKPNQGFDVGVSLGEKDGPLLYTYPLEAGVDVSSNSPSTTLTVGPGVYVLTAVMERMAMSVDHIDQQFALELSVGEEPDIITIPTQGDYTHPEVYTQRDGTGILTAQTPVILSETDLGGGQTQVLVSTFVNNSGNSPWQDVLVELAPSVDGEPALIVVSTPPLFDLGPGETTVSAQQVLLEVATTDLDALRPSILDGSRFRFSGKQQAVFAYPVQVIEESDFPPLAAGNQVPSVTSFPYAPIITSGTVWLEWEPYFKQPLDTIIIPPESIGEAFITQIQGRDKLLPALVADVVRFGAGFNIIFFDPSATNPLNPFGGAPVALPLVMKEGLIVNEMRFEGHPDDLGVTEIPETRQTGNGLSLAGLFPAPVPFHFNRIELSPGIEVSGSFGFRPKDLRVRLEMENFAIKTFEVSADYTADANLLLETREGADNTAEPLAMREATLLDLQLLDINLSSGFRFAPRLVIGSGASVSAPTSLSLPITAGLDISITAGVEDGVPYYDSNFTEIPLQISDPGLYEALGATAEVWLDAEIKALVAAGEGTIQTGPTLGARAQADLSVTPLLDPWWSLNAELSTFAGVELNLIGLITIVDAEQTLQSWPLAPFFPLTAEGPLAGPVALQSFTPTPGFKPLGNPATRWFRSLLPEPTGASLSDTFAFPLENTTDLLVGGGSIFGSMIARLTAEADLVWAMVPQFQFLGASGVPEPDGGFTLISGQRNSLRVARFDGNGTPVWKHSIFPTSGTSWFENTAIVRRSALDGTSEYFVLGQVIGSSFGGFHISVVKLDDNGDVLWSHVYPIQPFADEGSGSNPGAIALTADGDVLISGDTTVNLSEDPLEARNITKNGIVFKLDGDTGDVIWSTLIGYRGTPVLTSISEGPSGAVYVGGNTATTVLSQLPSMLLTKLDANGSLIDSVLIGRAPSSDPIPLGGESFYDTILDMDWVDGNLWICGQIGIFNAGSVGGVAEGASAFTAMVSENLDVSRLVIHAAPSTDSFDSIRATDNGLLVSGLSNSFHPWPNGASDEGQQTPLSLVTLMLPWEGSMRFHDASSGRQAPADETEPKAGSFYMTPRVIATSQFTIETNQGLFQGPGLASVTESSSLSSVVLKESYTTNTSVLALSPVFFDPHEYKSLEFIPKSLITDYSTFLQYYQLDSTDNSDGDPFDAEAEFFLGTSPVAADWGVVEFTRFIDETPSSRPSASPCPGP
jgi:hypothetical protein